MERLVRRIQVTVLFEVEMGGPSSVTPADSGGPVHGEAALQHRQGPPSDCADRGRTARVLRAVLANPSAASFFFRQAAAVPMAPYVSELGLDDIDRWIDDDADHLQLVLDDLELNDRQWLQPVLERGDEGELDGLHAAFTARPLSVRVEEVDG